MISRPKTTRLSCNVCGMQKDCFSGICNYCKTSQYIEMKSEDQLQAKCYQWFHNNHPDLRGLLWAVPNGGWRNKREAVKLKATGVVKGVHDLHLFYKGILYTFELKVDKNKQSKAQIDWGEKIRQQGALSYEVRDFEYFKFLIDSILE